MGPDTGGRWAVSSWLSWWVCCSPCGGRASFTLSKLTKREDGEEEPFCVIGFAVYSGEGAAIVVWILIGM